MKTVSLAISFEDLLGNKRDDMSDVVRRDRWAQWMKLAKQDGGDGDEWWSDTCECKGCARLDEICCTLMGLPCTVNPILSYRHGMPGMACMGAGFTPKQLELFPVTPNVVRTSLPSPASAAKGGR